MSLYLQALTRAYLKAPENTVEEDCLALLWERVCRREGFTLEEAEQWERDHRPVDGGDYFDRPE